MSRERDIPGETAVQLALKESAVRAVLDMAGAGDTIPFMARYRKERTGGLDEVAIANILKTAAALEELEKRKVYILKTIASQGKLGPELERQILSCQNPGTLEDLYLPYKPKRKTRGSLAEEKGLKPLADAIAGGIRAEAIRKEDFFGGKGQAGTWEQALQGASDILAERLNELPELRGALRKHFARKALIHSKAVKGKEEEGQKYRDYFNRQEGAEGAPSHRILAMFRAADEGILRLKIRPDEEESLGIIHKRTPFRSPFWKDFLAAMERDCYKRLLAPSLETELKKNLKERADEQAIRLFASNLRVLLMEAPLGQKGVLALDPGLRTGCKIVCLSPQGELLYHGVIYPLEPHKKEAQAKGVIEKLVKKFDLQAVAVGNGTGGREARKFCSSLDCLKGLPCVLVNESGASIYSASQGAREEFPDLDLTVRGAVSIGRRLMDPLAELVKLDPSSIGVGQYQHDVNQKALAASLDEVVMSCVNGVGVELNTASADLLAYVSGLNRKTAGAIIRHRNNHGPFASRQEIKKVRGIGEKAFEQASGFLRIRRGIEPLDNTGIHPEQYAFVKALAKSLGKTVPSLLAEPSFTAALKAEDYCNKEYGPATVKDILAELMQPGRDPRQEFKAFAFDDGVHTMEDLKKDMILPGIITNVTAFGAFVDLGVHQDGLIHISQLAEHFVSDPSRIVHPGQKLKVRILDVDRERKRISCSLKHLGQNA